MGKLVKSRQKASGLISGKTSACRNTGGRVDQQRSVRATRETGCGRRLCAAAKWGEQAKAANLILPHGRINDGSGILFGRKDIADSAGPEGNSLKIILITVTAMQAGKGYVLLLPRQTAIYMISYILNIS